MRDFVLCEGECWGRRGGVYFECLMFAENFTVGHKDSIMADNYNVIREVAMLYSIIILYSVSKPVGYY